MQLTIADDIIQATDLSAEELLCELAVSLFQQSRLTLEGASRLSSMDQLSFQRLLASRNIPIHYDISDLESDIATLQRLGQL
jgi:predicted HTH domain antitoxin